MGHFFDKSNSDYCVCTSFDLQLSNFGLDVEDLRQPKIHRIFRAWLEDWEKELLEVNDCVAEARLLEKYRDLMFLDPDTNKTFKVWGGNLEYHRGSRKRGITKGWGLVCIDENGEEEGWLLNGDVIELIGLHSQEGGCRLSEMEMSLFRTQAEMRTQAGRIGRVNYSVQVCRQ